MRAATAAPAVAAPRAVDNAWCRAGASVAHAFDQSGRVGPMLIGVLKEARPGETRVAATPATVAQLIKLGLRGGRRAGRR